MSTLTLSLRLVSNKANNTNRFRRFPAAAASLKFFSSAASYPSPPNPNPQQPNFANKPSTTRLGSLLTWLGKCLLPTPTPTSQSQQEQRLKYLQSGGGIGMTLLSITSSAKIRITPFMSTLAANPTFVSAMLAWMIAQSMKIFLNFFVDRKWDFSILFGSGGMPSSHSALCTALTTSVALSHGVADSLFPVSLGFTLIVMYDAIGVRRHAGMQAQVQWTVQRNEFQCEELMQIPASQTSAHSDTV